MHDTRSAVKVQTLITWTTSLLNPMAAEKKRQGWASVDTCRISSDAAAPGEIPGEIPREIPGEIPGEISVVGCAVTRHKQIADKFYVIS